MDDQVAAQKMFQRYLSRTNLEVIGITDPTQGLDMARKIQPALLILDVMMPNIDGWEVLQTLQLDPETKHIPVIICSAWGEPELARSLGAVAFLKKPVIQKDLLDVLLRLGLVQE
jgi:CheY-like chemotaxis protein